MTKLTAEQVLRDLRDCESSFRQAGRDGLAKCYSLAADHVARNLIESDEQRRERFESWCAKYDWDVERTKSGGYASGWTHDLWDTWQAALTWRGETKGGET